MRERKDFIAEFCRDPYEEQAIRKRFEGRPLCASCGFPMKIDDVFANCERCNIHVSKRLYEPKTTLG